MAVENAWQGIIQRLLVPTLAICIRPLGFAHDQLFIHSPRHCDQAKTLIWDEYDTDKNSYVESLLFYRPYFVTGQAPLFALKYLLHSTNICYKAPIDIVYCG